MRPEVASLGLGRGNVTRLVRAVTGRYFVFCGNHDVRKAGGYVKELCNSILWGLRILAERPLSHLIFNFTLDPAPRLADFVATVASVANIGAPPLSLPYLPLLAAAHVAQGIASTVGLEQPLDPTRVRKLVRSNNISSAVLRSLGYRRQFSLRSALEDWRAMSPSDWRMRFLLTTGRIKRANRSSEDEMRPLRICHVIEACGAGVGRHVVDLTAGQLAWHDVTLIYSPLRAETGFLSEISDLSNLKAIPLHLRRAPHPMDLFALRSLRRVLKREGPFDVVHGHSSKGGALSRLAALGTNSIKVYTPHAFFTADPTLRATERALFAAAERLLSRAGDRIICVSPEEYAHALSLGIDRSTLVCIPNGRSAKTLVRREQARAALGLPPEAIVVGFIGRLVRQKAPDRLIQAFLKIQSIPGSILAIVGDGPLGAELRSTFGGHAGFERIIWTGHRKGDEIISAFDILAVPSRYEGFPYVYLEALAAGLPIVTMEVGGARSVVARRRKTDSLFPNGTTRSWGPAYPNSCPMQPYAEECLPPAYSAQKNSL